MTVSYNNRCHPWTPDQRHMVYAYTWCPSRRLSPLNICHENFIRRTEETTHAHSCLGQLQKLFFQRSKTDFVFPSVKDVKSKLFNILCYQVSVCVRRPKYLTEQLACIGMACVTDCYFVGVPGSQWWHCQADMRGSQLLHCRHIEPTLPW